MSTATETQRKAPAGERVADWADGRLGIYGLAKANMRKIFPDHWSFMLGEIASTASSSSSSRVCT